MLRYTALIQNPRRFLALTGYTVDEFRALLSFFRVRFQAYVARFTLEGKPRQNRTYSTYKNKRPLGKSCKKGLVSVDS